MCHRLDPAEQLLSFARNALAVAGVADDAGVERFAGAPPGDEAQLERKWPQRYNSAGHVAWSGRLYGPGSGRPFARGVSIYHGRWGSAPFQSLYQGPSSPLGDLPTTPEWYMLVAALTGHQG